MDRIETFLNEDEIPEEVSSLKHDHVDTQEDYPDGLGISNASFKWNELQDSDTTKPKNAVGTDLNPNDSVSVNTEDRKFELKDINIFFPEGELTVVTGPSMCSSLSYRSSLIFFEAASGKTALLVRFKLPS